MEAGTRLDARLGRGISAHLLFRFNSSTVNEPLDRTKEFDQLDATTVVFPGDTATVDGHLNLILELGRRVGPGERAA